jgi:hypothetical protein
MMDFTHRKCSDKIGLDAPDNVKLLFVKVSLAVVARPLDYVGYEKLICSRMVR